MFRKFNFSQKTHLFFRKKTQFRTFREISLVQSHSSAKLLQVGETFFTFINVNQHRDRIWRRSGKIRTFNLGRWSCFQLVINMAQTNKQKQLNCFPGSAKVPLGAGRRSFFWNHFITGFAYALRHLRKRFSEFSEDLCSRFFAQAQCREMDHYFLLSKILIKKFFIIKNQKNWN